MSDTRRDINDLKAQLKFESDPIKRQDIINEIIELEIDDADYYDSVEHMNFLIEECGYGQ